jgi:hypothetical protein
MTPLVYNLSMLAGLGCCVAGACIVWGAGVSLMVAGAGLIGLTLLGARA